MAAVSCTLSEEQFLCSICLEVFTDPVTTPCGHSFCRVCINKHWDSSDQYNCPVCKQDFSSRPSLKINIVLAEMVFEFKNKPGGEDIQVETMNSELQSSAPAEVSCDVCPEPRLRALKSCLVCLASYCQIHLQPHLTNPRLKRHQLIQPLPNLEERICPEHDRPLELFCREHSHFICLHCMSEGHKDHQTIPLKEEGEEHQATLKNQIKERRQKIEEIQRSVELSQRNADTEIQEGLRVYNALMECVQQSLDKFKQNIVEKHKKNEEEAAQLIEQIQTEISALEQRGAEMEQLWSSGDHLHFVQTFTSVKPAPQLNDWTERNICSTYSRMLAEALTELQDNELKEEIHKVFKAELKKLQDQYAVKVTLDHNTAHPNINVEYYSTKAQYTIKENNWTFSTTRFTSKVFVLGRQAFSSGKFYFEVAVKGSRQWAVGVAKKSVHRTGNIRTQPYYGFYLLEWDSEKSNRCQVGGCYVNLSHMPMVIGVYVDYEEGLVSFFDVYTAVLISSITNCSFTEDLLPLVSPGNGGGAMQVQ
ncbi:E3 ubiquitin/ISG15 ligase TRIM25-like isoform X2 [Boleophthalmus pectinirostris]|uniref:E3 ubiquitin/ISG15 ligase TRIM25-like isoform X2 n=1 Tax=Boleophthalmus pectinirostris TaxID=150288 RepID=UPI00242E10E4|nr:E3 ubiquitin/ISG15 ligase TRIM25-like isoform X2 [Boleophthalmus pectinirostris]